MLYLFTNSLYLSGRFTVAYHNIIGEAAYLAGIEQNNINGLLIAGSLYRPACYLYCFQKLSLPVPDLVFIPTTPLPSLHYRSLNITHEILYHNSNSQTEESGATGGNHVIILC